jgi:porphobilinogen synthase
MFVVPGKGVRREIPSMPGQCHFSVDELVRACVGVSQAGIPAVILFGLPEEKDEVGSEAWHPDGVVQRAIRAVKREVPDLLVMADACFCEYTTHGHCGVLRDPRSSDVDNDATLENLGRLAISYAQAGVDVVAPSGMMDGAIGFLRESLDEAEHENVALLSYAAKYASAYYGPFRAAVDSNPSHGDRRGYQMDAANIREAMREVAADIDEGADMVMVKPALAYLDVISEVRREFDVPVAAYNVSGEYAMLHAAADRGWLDLDNTVMETMTSIRRAGADLILTYHALRVAGLLRDAGR